MSEPEKFVEKFLERWSRRKLAAAQRAGDKQDKSPDGPDGEPPGSQETAATRVPPAPARDRLAPEFDPATLPPLESIDAASDIRAFLAPGVPVELSRAALRRAWLADPAIRDFIGIAENQWDFTRPDGVPGFGALDLPANFRRVLSELSGVVEHESAARTEQAAEKTEEETPLPRGRNVAAQASAAASGIDPPIVEQAIADHAVLQDGATSEPNRSPTPRRHGRALPK